ncbi:MAG: hypothetical protein ACT6S0_02845 [Roseateles sp.]|uniref:hypothetical protein n=1 Tax=Roseateles sp. TaxID=1971397 RepID=UPI004035AD69
MRSMVSVVTGYGNGLANGSKDVLGGAGELGNAAHGRAGERVTVNAANGNLIIQGRDEYLVGVGPDVDLLRTYNSLGGWDGDNNDGWRIGYYRKVELSSGTANGAGSIAKRVEADGSERAYAYNGTAYVSKEGGGQYDTLSFDAGSQSWTWTDGDSGAKETYVLGGGLYRLTQVTDPEGNAVKVSYDAGTGRITTLTTHKAGSSPAVETIALNYSGVQLSSITTSYQDGGQSKTRSVTSYTYYPAGSGAKTGKLQTVTTDLTPGVAGHADGKVYTVTYDYDANGRLSSIQQTDGSQITIGYDANGRVASMSSPSGLGVRSTVFDYSVAGTTTVQEKLGTQSLQSSVLKYGTAGELLEVAGAVMGGAAFKQSYVYNTEGDLLTVTNAAGQTTTYGYDGAGGTNGAWTRRTDHAGNVVDRSYDPVTRLLLTEAAYSIADSDGAAGAAQPGGARKTQYVYDTTNIAKRRLAYVVGPQGEVTRQIYNSEGQLTRQVQYTGALFTAGSPSFTSLESWVTTAAQAQTLERQVTEYDYDLRGQVREQRRYASASLSGGGVVDGGLSTTLYTYDAFGRLLHRQDASGVKLSYEYDGLGRVIKSLDTNNVSTIYSYDDAGRKTSVQLANGQTTVQLFDTQGNLVSSDVMGAGNTEANPKWLGKTEYAYDALGRLWRTSDATGVKTFTLYDVSGRKSADIAANGQLTEYMYDAAGRLIQTIAYITPLSQAKLNGLAATNKISDAGIRPVAAFGQDRITTYYYDTAGRLSGVQDADGFLTHTKYDGTGAITSQTTFANVTTVTRLDVMLGTTRSTVPTQPAVTEDVARDRAIRNLYDASGRLGAQINGENALTVWTYDAAGNPLGQLRRSAVLSTAEAAYNLTQLKALTPLADDEFTQWLYDGQGRQIAQVNAEGHLTEYRYDNAGRLQETLQYLKQAFKPVVSGSPVTLRKLLLADLNTLRPSLSTPAPLKTSRSYNTLGLLERETAVDGTVTYYQYDNLQRLKSTTLAESQPERRERLMEYDDWGRVKSTRTQGDATGVTTTYDAAGRRTSVTDARGYKTVYYYDTEGRQRYAILIDPLTGGEVVETIYSSFSELSASVSYSARLSTTDANALTGGSVSQALTDKIDLLSDAAKDNRNAVTYNRRGLIQQAIDALGHKTDTTYNAFGQLDREVRDIDPVGTANARRLTLDYGYNRRGNLTRVLSSGPDLVSTTTRSSFDALGRLGDLLDELRAGDQVAPNCCLPAEMPGGRVALGGHGAFHISMTFQPPKTSA